MICEAVDRGAGGGDQLIHTAGLGGLHHIEASVAHHAESGPRIGCTGGDAKGGHVDDGIHPLCRRQHCVGIADVATNKGYKRITKRILHVREALENPSHPREIPL